MIRAARFRAVEQLLAERSVVSTQQLADELGVSLVTVRRDLDTLASQGRIERVFGGARLPAGATVGGADAVGPDSLGARDTDRPDEPFAQVLERNQEAKRQIAARAAQLVTDGETVFIDVGTTAYELARALQRRHLTVVTASLGVVDLLGEDDGIDLVLLGGEYNSEYRCTHGSHVADSLSALQIDRAFLGCAGVSDRGLIRDTDTRQAAVKQATLRVAGSTALLAAADKFPGTGAFTAGSLAHVDHLVTDLDASSIHAHLGSAVESSSTEVLHT